MSGKYEAPGVDDRAIWDIWLSMHYLPTVTVCDEVGLFDLLNTAPLTLDDIAEKLSLNRRALNVLLPMLAALSLVYRREGKYYLSSVASTYLESKSPYFWGPLFAGYKDDSPIHAQLLGLLRKGDAGVDGRPSDGWAAGKISDDFARYISKFMHAHSLPASVAAARSGVFDGVTSLLDVGGGSGVFAIAAAQYNDALKTTVMDLDTMCSAAQDLFINGSGVEARVDTAAIDMFREDWPTGYDGHFFSNIFHDWNEETNAALAKKSFDALDAGGKIFLHEQLMNDNDDGPLTTASFSVLMLRGTQGKQYSLSELRVILEGAGFVNVSARQTSPYYSVVSAEKPGK